MWKSSSSAAEGNFFVEGDRYGRDAKISQATKHIDTKFYENMKRDNDCHRQSRDCGEGHYRQMNPAKRHYGTPGNTSKSHKKYRNGPVGDDYSDYDRFSDCSIDDSRYTQSGRYDRKNYDYCESSGKSYNRSRHYKSKYIDRTRSRRSMHPYDSPYGVYDRHHRDGRSRSPRTPFSDRRSPINHKRYSPPPLPPFDPPVAPKSSEECSAIRSNSLYPYTSNSASFSHFEEYRRSEFNNKKDNLSKDPRNAEALYGARLVTAFDVVRIPRGCNVDSTLDSPPFTISMNWDSVNISYSSFQSPLERLNNYLSSPRPRIDNEWWLKGTSSLLVLGIPRHWSVCEILVHLVESYDKMIASQDIFPEEWKYDSDSEFSDKLGVKVSLKSDCERLGIKKFILLFGEAGTAINELPSTYPRLMDQNTPYNDPKSKVSGCVTFCEQPEAMGLLVFGSEEKALEFWATLAATLIQAYPYTMRICPDPSGWRIYSEALSIWLNNEHLTHNTISGQDILQSSQGKDDQSMDLLSVLTTRNNNNNNNIFHADASGSQNNQSVMKTNTQKSQPHLTFISPYISRQEEANVVAKALVKLGIRCMFHKPSRIMSLHFPNEQILQNIAVCQKSFISPSGSKVQCCFVKFDGKFLPVLKRANVEHISNAIDRNKNNLPKHQKFQPPLVGIVTTQELS